MKYLNLTKTQTILFYSAIISIIVQTICIYCFFESKKKFQFDKCLGYIFFSAISLLFYYKMSVP